MTKGLRFKPFAEPHFTMPSWNVYHKNEKKLFAVLSAGDLDRIYGHRLRCTAL